MDWFGPSRDWDSPTEPTSYEDIVALRQFLDGIATEPNQLVMSWETYQSVMFYANLPRWRRWLYVVARPLERRALRRWLAEHPQDATHG